jgi:tetratricopeptide (TPR) repeat protein
LKKYFILFILFYATAWSQNKAVLDSIVYYDNQGDYFKAISLSDRESKKLVLQKKYPAFCKIAIKEALLYTKLKDHSKGVQVLFNALKIIDKKAMPIEKVQLTKIIADIYYKVKNVQKSIHYYNIANKNCRKLKNDTLLAATYQGCYKLHGEQKNTDSIKFYATEILKLSRVKGTMYRKATAYNNMYFYYCEVNKPETAKKYLDTCANYANLSKNRLAVTSSLTNLAYHYMVYDKNYKKAEKK